MPAQDRSRLDTQQVKERNKQAFIHADDSATAHFTLIPPGTFFLT